MTDPEYYTTDRDELLQDPRCDDFPYARPIVKREQPDDDGLNHDIYD